MKHALSEAALPRGFRFAATACGLKKTGALDLAMFTSEVPASAAAVFTQNLVVAPPVLVSKANLRASKGRMRGVVINAGNANCATGEEGRLASERTVAEAAKHVVCKPSELFVCSTGVIGVPLAVDRILRRLPQLARQQRPSARSFAEVSLAICTTDTQPKTAAASFKMAGKRVHLVGCAKGAGMIHPNMATTLAFVATDANIAPALLQKTLRDITTRTFNSISIDGDTSTNDTLLVLANGQAGAPAIAAGTKAHRDFAAALEDVCHSLALQIVADGEGAQRVIEIEVRGAKSEPAARQIAQTIATSPLVKTAFAGGDPNWAYVVLPDEYATGSSLMPQKKNPDSWELIRGKTGRIHGALLGLLTTLKGLPTGYQRDLQEDKEALFAAHDQVAAMLGIATGALAATKFNGDRLRAAASNPVLFATEGADYLVHRGLPFRQAHDIIGRVLREAERQSKPWTQLSLEDVQKISPLFEKDFLSALNVEKAIATKSVPGGTAADSVKSAIAALQERITMLHSGFVSKSQSKLQVESGSEAETKLQAKTQTGE